ncbi:hypothetical protein S7711_04487 [Stachybotrys chartarum IBT 7711]|uniref:DUF7924 domain-containing protein n=1 Tax=Stachybotrys chartarum (strain CBS 109288 / IBT 7711) TaxID=1280523 RepID=A0A084BA70_STACB|nr:hypothetical protein S7711_04487 [Stachybotrys chartarum IBT 7711]
MNNGVSKRGPAAFVCAYRCPRRPGRLVNPSGTELPRSRREQPRENGDPAGDTTPVQARKKRLDATESDPSPAKRARLTRTDTPQLGVEDEKLIWQLVQTTVKQPKPNYPKHPYASFLKDFFDPLHPAPSPASVHTFVSEWLESVGSDREKHCRSDSHLHRSKRRSRFEEPHEIGTGDGLHTGCRWNNLALNNIHIRPSTTPLPDVVLSHIETVRANRDSPGLSSDELNQVVGQLDILAEGCDEDDVDLVPANPANPYKVTQTKPDKLYGYSENPNALFTQAQALAQTTLHPTNPHYPAATSQGLWFPFFAIEFKAAGGTRGDPWVATWVATNRCAGASSACLNAVDRLNTSLPKHPRMQWVDNFSYSIADDNTAQLYMLWKEDDLNYYLQWVGVVLLSDTEHFKNFRKHVRNVLHLGQDTRLM